MDAASVRMLRLVGRGVLQMRVAGSLVDVVAREMTMGEARSLFADSPDDVAAAGIRVEGRIAFAILLAAVALFLVADKVAAEARAAASKVQSLQLMARTLLSAARPGCRSWKRDVGHTSARPAAWHARLHPQSGAT